MLKHHAFLHEHHASQHAWGLLCTSTMDPGVMGAMMGAMMVAIVGAMMVAMVGAMMGAMMGATMETMMGVIMGVMMGATMGLAVSWSGHCHSAPWSLCLGLARFNPMPACSM